MKETNKHESNKSVYKKVEIKEWMMTELVESSNKFLETLRLEDVYQRKI